ncbi:MAG: acylphosphatase, partial [Deltaproteobacteria bacterium]|nr:acylphosphatase [Deltaproteobacteria bacterium]
METRLKIVIQGIVQGVGFRPFIYLLAHENKIKGWIENSAQGVQIEAEGPPNNLRRFLFAIEKRKPELAVIQSLEHFYLEPKGYRDFQIKKSDDSGNKTVLIMPDIATCPDCLREIFDPKDRRYLYPFNNCAHCGPRYSIIEALPYDRKNTSMKSFKMCRACKKEYDDPLNRRFHAQPVACPDCGPRVSLLESSGKALCGETEALLNSVKALRDGKIVAVKGLGGFHLMLDA